MNTQKTSRLNAMQHRTNRINKQGARKDGGGNKNSRRSVYSTVACHIHGKESKAGPVREVRCAIPFNKRERFAGCPICAKERAIAKAKAEQGFVFMGSNEGLQVTLSV